MFDKLKAWLADNDWWYLAVIGACLLAVIICWQLHGLLIIILGCGLTVAVAEFVFVKLFNISVSDDYRKWRMTHKGQSAFVLTLLAVFIAALIYHFTRNYIP